MKEVELPSSNLSENTGKGIERKSCNQDAFWRSAEMTWCHVPSSRNGNSNGGTVHADRREVGCLVLVSDRRLKTRSVLWFSVKQVSIHGFKS